MKKSFTLQSLAAGMLFAISGVAHSCDLSGFTLDKVTSLGNNKYKLDVTFCAGGGRSNSRYGADQRTGNFAFYLSKNAVLDTFSSPYMISPMTGDTFFGYKLTDNSRNSLSYDASVLYYLKWDFSSIWSCITVNCGPVQSVCGSLSFTTIGLPDTVWLRGMEAAGNIRGGCTNLRVFPRCVNSSLTANLGADQTVYNGTSPNCATLSPSATGGSGSYTYQWSNGSTASSQTLCPTATTNYWVKVTDGYGCSLSDTITVNYKDVRCGKKLNYVAICYKGSNKCISPSSLSYYTSRGATIGDCGSQAYNPDQTNDDPNTGIVIFPNPAVSDFVVESNYRGTYTIDMTNLQGQKILELFQGTHTDEYPATFDVDTKALSKGVYIIRTQGTDINGKAISSASRVVIQ